MQMQSRTREEDKKRSRRLAFKYIHRPPKKASCLQSSLFATSLLCSPILNPNSGSFSATRTRYGGSTIPYTSTLTVSPVEDSYHQPPSRLQDYDFSSHFDVYPNSGPIGARRKPQCRGFGNQSTGYSAKGTPLWLFAQQFIAFTLAARATKFSLAMEEQDDKD